MMGHTFIISGGGVVQWIYIYQFRGGKYNNVRRLVCDANWDSRISAVLFTIKTTSFNKWLDDYLSLKVF